MQLHRSEDRPGSQERSPFPPRIPEALSFYLHMLLAGSRALGMLSFRRDPGLGCAPMSRPERKPESFGNPVPHSGSCTPEASRLPAIDRIHRQNPCASRRCPVSGIASPGENPTPLAPRNADTLQSSSSIFLPFTNTYTSTFLRAGMEQGGGGLPPRASPQRRPARELRSDSAAHPEARKPFRDPCHCRVCL